MDRLVDDMTSMSTALPTSARPSLPPVALELVIGSGAKWPIALTVHLFLRHYGSQSSKHWFTADTFNALMRIRGLECRSGTGYAEAFHARKVVLGR